MNKGSFIILLLALVVSWGCTHAPAIPEKTVYSDLYPQLPRTEYYKQLALGAYKNEDYAQAVEYFKLSLLHDPSNNESRYWLGASYYQNKQDNLALVELDKLDAVHSFEYPRLKIIADIYEAVGSYEKALTLQQKIYELRHENFSLWRMYQINLNISHLSEALQNLNELEKNGDDPYRLHLGRYEVYRRQGQLDLGLTELQKAEKVKPLDFLAMKKIVETQYDLRQWPAAYGAGVKFTKYHLFDGQVSDWLTTACLQVGAYDDALAELKKQKAVSPDSVELDFKIAHVLFLKRDFVNPEELYSAHFNITQSDQAALKNNVSEVNSFETMASWSDYYPTAQVQLANLEWKSNQYSAALERLQRAHQLRPDSLVIYKQYSQYLVWNKNYSEALSLVESGIEYFPSDDTLRVLAAYIHLKTNNMKAFQEEIVEAQKLNPENAEIYAVLAELSYVKKQPSELEFLAKKAIELKTRNKNIKPLLAWALLQQDKVSEAARLFEEVYDGDPQEIFVTESLADLYQRNALYFKNKEFKQKSADLKHSLQEPQQALEGENQERLPAGSVNP